MNIYLHDGVEFDLEGEFVDVTGVIWTPTGELSPAGEPMLRSDGPGQDLPLPDAYHYHGPLIPRRRRVGGPARQSLGYAASWAAGYIESPEEFGVRIGGRP